MIDDQGRLENEQTKTHREKILELLQKGEHLSELDMFKFGYGTSFRTRVSELKNAGYDIQSYFETSPNGARYKRYFIPKELKEVEPCDITHS